MTDKTKLADKLIIWKIVDGENDRTFKSYDELHQYMENCIDSCQKDSTCKKENESPKECAELSRVGTLVDSVIANLHSKITLDEINILLDDINTAQDLNLTISTTKKHTAYGTNKNKRKLVVKIEFA